MMRADVSGLSSGMPLVSVVIPCHNAGLWLVEAIESVLGQTHPRIEVIVVDDGSNDNSVELSRRFGDKIRLEQGSWGNGNAARNHGLAIATGHWIQFLDADDYLLEMKIASQLAAVTDSTEVVYSPVILRETGADGDWHETIQSPVEGADIFAQWLAWQFCQTGGVLWRADAIRRIGGWKAGLPCCQDNELTLRALTEELDVVFVNTPAAVYRIWSDATVCRKNPEQLLQVRIRLMEEMIAWLRGRDKLTPGHMDAAGRAFFEMARGLALRDLPMAKAFHDSYKQRDLIRVYGPAAPRGYRLIYALLGFVMAERIALRLRGNRI